MPNLDALDTAIAIVIVLLLLSLIVQSVQSMLKKLLKIKSRQLEQSLVDLFQHVLKSPSKDQEDQGGENETEPAASKAVKSFLKSPMLQLLIPRKKHPSEQAGGEVEKLYKAVVIRFKEIGRVSAAGKHMLDSISKEDLLKVLRSVAPNALLPELVTQLKDAIQGINALDTAIAEIKLDKLGGDASAKFAAMHEALAPVLSDMQSLMAGKELKPELLLGDVMNLRQIKLDEVLKLLGEVQKKVEQDVEAETSKQNLTRVQELQTVAAGLKGIAQAIIAVRQKFDVALAPLRTKLNEVEVWYDTVMQSFDERYARGMKTWSFAISFAVVVFLNANFFSIYRNIASSDVTRNLIVQAGPEVFARSKAATADATARPSSSQAETTPSPSPSPSPSASPGSVTLTTVTTTSPPTGVTTTTTTEKARTETPEELLASLKKIREQLKNDVDTYAGLGFTPLKWAQVRHWASTLPPSEKDWLINRKHDLRTLLGWLITAMLLSVGAPFWQDTLESLFGVKSLLRKRGDIKNVETESGAGNPKP